MKPALGSIANATVVLITCLVPLAQASDEVQCPSLLVVEETAVTPTGWQSGGQRLEFRLDAASLLVKNRDGTEEAQIPDEQESGKKVTLVWSVDTLLKAYEATFRCQYKGTRINLSKPLSPGMNSCWAVFVRAGKNGSQEITEAKCK